MNKIEITISDDIKLKLIEMKKVLAGMFGDELAGEGIDKSQIAIEDCSHCDGACEVTCSTQCESSCVDTCENGCGNCMNP